MKSSFKFIRVMAALVIAVVVFGLFVVGCGTDDPNPNGKDATNNNNNNNSTSKTETIKGIECVLVDAGYPTKGGYVTKYYYIGKYEITQEQYKKVMVNLSFDNNYGIGYNYPASEVRLVDAVEFCNKVGGRLPTEQEWEFAASGGNYGHGYKYSGSDNLDEVAWHGGSSYINGKRAQPVGQKKANELGIYDMTGNVYEWCSDEYIDESGDKYRVLRGGSFINIVNNFEDNFAFNKNKSMFWHTSENYKSITVGFRIVFDKKE